MSDVKRITIEIHWRTDSNAVLHEFVTPEGKYVLASDYDAIAARCKKAEGELAAYMRDEMVKVSVNLSPAAMEGAIRDKLIALGWTPPPTPDGDA